MDLTNINTASAIQQSQTANQVQVTVAGKVLDEARSEGAAIVSLIQSAGAIGVGPGDPGVAAATGLGGRIDTHA